MLNISIRVGRYEGDLSELVKKFSHKFAQEKIGREDVPKYQVDIDWQGEQYEVVVSDRSMLSRGDYNILMTVIGPRYERAETIMRDLESKLGMPTWEAPEILAENLRILTRYKAACQAKNN